ncbi:MAG: hypothetical protein PVH89_07485 [Gammaproteobacteria bacterium]|jgi:hypothetical protein
MKNLLISALVAAVISLAAIAVYDRQAIDLERPAPVASSGGGSGAVDARPLEPASVGPSLSYTDALVEDTWVNAGRTAGSDRRTLTDAAASVCYLTKIEISGIQGPDDSNACAIEIDDFTGFWQLIATVDEGGRSEVRCNARCLSWDSE